MPISKRDANRLRQLTADIESTRVERQALVIKVFEKGATVTEIARETGMSSSGIAKMLDRAGLRSRPALDSDELRDIRRSGARKRWDT